MIDKINKERLQKVPFEGIKGWVHDNHLDAFTTLNKSAKCGSLYQKILSNNMARRYFEKNYQPYRILKKHNEGSLYTGYFEPTLFASLDKTEKYHYPIYGPPKNNSDKIINLTRKELEEKIYWDLPILAWLSDPVALYFMHIQGSGTLKFENGDERRFVFHSKNNHEYTSIGRYLTDNNHINRDDISMESVKKWLYLSPENMSKKNINKSFIFFKEDEKSVANPYPLGQLGIRLTPFRSLAVDMSIYSINTPIWLDTEIQIKDSKKFEIFQRLMFAQDKGSAIKGLFRGDIFFGNNENAGNMKSQGDIIIFDKI
tara:strand:+ start:286 stop:1227 length:942 start_codon:yes stop_codon:yes gene_type:complete